MNGAPYQCPQPSHGGKQPALGKRSMCHHRPPIGEDVHYQLGQSPERVPIVEHSDGLAEGTEADRFEDASARTGLQ